MPVRKAVIMAGGEGCRMKPVSMYLPKCYLPVFDEPLLIKQIRWLTSAGVNEIILTVDGKFGHILKALLAGINIDKGLQIDVVTESNVMGIGHALLGLKQRLGTEPFIFLLGDEYFKQPLFFEEIRKMREPCNILGATHYTDPDLIMQGCNLLLDEEGVLVRELVEKPSLGEIVSDWCWSGVAVFDSSVLEELEYMCREDKALTNKVLINVLNNLIKRGTEVRCFKEKCENINLTDINDYYRAFVMQYSINKDIK